MRYLKIVLTTTLLTVGLSHAEEPLQLRYQDGFGPRCQGGPHDTSDHGHAVERGQELVGAAHTAREPGGQHDRVYPRWLLVLGGRAGLLHVSTARRQPIN